VKLVAHRKLSRRARQYRKAIPCQAAMQQDLDLGGTCVAQSLAMKPRRYHPRVIDQQRIPCSQIVRQIAHAAMDEASVRLNHHQSRTVTRRRGTQRDLRVRQFEIEQADIHGGAL